MIACESTDTTVFLPNEPAMGLPAASPTASSWVMQPRACAGGSLSYQDRQTTLLPINTASLTSPWTEEVSNCKIQWQARLIFLECVMSIDRVCMCDWHGKLIYNKNATFT